MKWDITSFFLFVSLMLMTSLHWSSCIKWNAAPPFLWYSLDTTLRIIPCPFKASLAHDMAVSPDRGIDEPSSEHNTCLFSLEGNSAIIASNRQVRLFLLVWLITDRFRTSLDPPFFCMALSLFARESLLNALSRFLRLNFGWSGGWNRDCSVAEKASPSTPSTTSVLSLSALLEAEVDRWRSSNATVMASLNWSACSHICFSFESDESLYFAMRSSDAQMNRSKLSNKSIISLSSNSLSSKLVLESLTIAISSPWKYKDSGTPFDFISSHLVLLFHAKRRATTWLGECDWFIINSFLYALSSGGKQFNNSVRSLYTTAGQWLNLLGIGTDSSSSSPSLCGVCKPEGSMCASKRTSLNRSQTSKG